MSWWYHYYIGREDPKTGMIYPAGPYGEEGNWLPVFSVSASFSSDLHRRFYPIDKEFASEELIEKFSFEFMFDDKPTFYAKMLRLHELPEGSYIKSGYFLIKDVENYRKDGDPTELFYERLSPELYAVKMKNELVFGKSAPVKDIEGNELPTYSCADYMYYAFPDYHSEEYEAQRIRIGQDIAWTSRVADENYVVILQEG